jgi:cell pole-organizing protein PopZ
MNKPAPKEPSMDEILSSIRQIIADDDASTVRKPIPPPTPPRSFAPPPPRPLDPVTPMPQLEPEALALSAEQILYDSATDDQSGFPVSFNELVAAQPAPANIGLVDPDDITFDTAPEPFVPPPRPVSAYERPRPVSVARAAPLPDPRLTADMAEQLLEPAAQSVVKSAFAKLNSLSTIGSNLTIEEMMRDMLRPMLKEWLDENLPAVVERMVEQEIARVSRGGR